MLVKDPNKQLLRLYEVPPASFEEGEEDDGPVTLPAVKEKEEGKKEDGEKKDEGGEE